MTEPAAPGKWKRLDLVGAFRCVFVVYSRCAAKLTPPQYPICHPLPDPRPYFWRIVRLGQRRLHRTDCHLRHTLPFLFLVGGQNSYESSNDPAFPVEAAKLHSIDGLLLGHSHLVGNQLHRLYRTIPSSIWRDGHPLRHSNHPGRHYRPHRQRHLGVSYPRRTGDVRRG